ncbi:MAG: hypothetical protein Kow0092_08820 [Deferrisomatales bacterium]
MEEVKVTIDEEGNVKVTVFGAKGPRCLEITEKLEALLGGAVEREFTSEYYQEEEAVQQKDTVETKT